MYLLTIYSCITLSSSGQWGQKLNPRGTRLTFATNLQLACNRNIISHYFIYFSYLLQIKALVNKCSMKELKLPWSSFLPSRHLSKQVWRLDVCSERKVIKEITPHNFDSIQYHWYITLYPWLQQLSWLIHCRADKRACSTSCKVSGKELDKRYLEMGT